MRKSDAQLQLSGGAAVSVDLLTIGASGVSAFAGINGGGPDRIGLALGGVEFALALATDKADPTRRWTALDAAAGSAAFLGVPGVTVSADTVAIGINRPAADGKLIDFAAQPLAVKTGPTTTRTLDLAGADGALLEATGNFTIDLFGFFQVSGRLGLRKSNGQLKLSVVVDYAAQPLTVRTGPGTTRTLDLDGGLGSLLEASGTLDVNVFDFFNVQGGFAVRKAAGQVTLSDASVVDADLLTLGGAGVSAFAGLNGGTPDQLGLSLGQVDFALALITDQADPSRQWTTLQATAGLAAFVGTDAITVTAQNLEVAINQGVAANHPGAPSVQVNTSYRLQVFPDTVGAVTFTYQTHTAAATVARTDSDATVAAAVRTALESLPGIGAGNVTVTGSRTAGFTVEFGGALAGQDVVGLTVQTAATTPGTVTVSEVAACGAGVNEVQTLTRDQPRQNPPAIATSVSERVRGATGFGEVQALTIAAPLNAAGFYAGPGSRRSDVPHGGDSAQRDDG